MDDESAGADLLARGIPIGLMHSMGTMDEVALRADAAAVTRITHGSPVAFTLVEAVARAVAIAARQETPLGDLRLAVAVGLPRRRSPQCAESGSICGSALCCVRGCERAGCCRLCRLVPGSPGGISRAGRGDGCEGDTRWCLVRRPPWKRCHPSATHRWPGVPDLRFIGRAVVLPNRRQASRPSN